LYFFVSSAVTCLSKKTQDTKRDSLDTPERVDAESGVRNSLPQRPSTQTEVGRALAASGVPREQLFVTVKLGCEQHGEAAVAAAKAAKAALGVEALDVLSIGWPVALRPGTTEVDTTCTLEGTWAAMEAMVDSGVTRYIGVSNFDLPQVRRCIWLLFCCRRVQLHSFIHRLGCHLGLGWLAR
jgi:hypothetical protein